MSNTQLHLLIVEDDSSTQFMYRCMIGETVDLTIVASVSEAVEFLNQSKVDLALIDLSLGGDEDGLVLIRHMKAKEALKDIPAIAVTAHAFARDRMNALEAGCDKFVTKPISRQLLLELINNYGNGRIA